jgi:hypothetical protein
MEWLLLIAALSFAAEISQKQSVRWLSTITLFLFWYRVTFGAWKRISVTAQAYMTDSQPESTNWWAVGLVFVVAGLVIFFSLTMMRFAIEFATTIGSKMG